MDIYLRAYLDKNFGDDMMIRLFCNELCEHNIHLYCKDERFFSGFDDIKNLEMTSTPPDKVNCGGVKYKLSVNIGGSIFKISSMRSKLSRFKTIMNLRKMKKNGCKSVILGSNVGPFHGVFAKTLAKMHMETGEFITVRDKEAKAFCDTHLKKTASYLYPDVLFALKDDMLKPSGERSGLGISVYNGHAEQFDAYCAYMAAIADEYITRTGEAVSLISFDTGKEDDVRAARTIYSLMKSKNVRHISHEGDGNNIIEAIGSVRHMIAARFHACVMCMKMQRPFIPLCYSNKTENLLNDFGYEGIRLYYDGGNGLSAGEIAHSLINSDRIYSTFDESLYRDAHSHFDRVKELLL